MLDSIANLKTEFFSLTNEKMDMLTEQTKLVKGSNEKTKARVEQLSNESKELITGCIRLEDLKKCRFG